MNPLQPCDIFLSIFGSHLPITRLYDHILYAANELSLSTPSLTMIELLMTLASWVPTFKYVQLQHVMCDLPDGADCRARDAGR